MAAPDGGDRRTQPECKPGMKGPWSLFSYLSLCWIDPLLWQGCRKPLEANNLYTHPSESDSERLLDSFTRYWRVELQRRSVGKKPRLLVAILRCLWFKMVVHNILFFVEIAMLVGQSVLLGYLTDTFTLTIEEQPDNSSSSRNTSAESGGVDIPTARYLYAGGISLLAIVVVFVHMHVFLLGYVLAMQSRLSMTSAIYHKVLSLSQATVSRVSSGHIVNLASNDVQRLDLCFIMYPVLWIGPLHLAVVTYLVYLEVGWFAFLMTAFTCIQIPLQVIIGIYYAKLRFKSALVTDKRVHIMNEVITGIRVIKMYAWEYAFKRVVTMLRKKESLLVLKAGLVRASNLALSFVSTPLVMFVVFTAYTASGGLLTPKNVFTTLSLVVLLRLTTVKFMSALIIALMEGRVVLVRLQRLLEMKELKSVQSLDEDTEEVCINVKNMSACWSDQPCKQVLNNINFSMGCGLMSVVGSVGAGKSTLLQCLLQELVPVEGSVQVTGTVAYCSQDAWVYSATLRDNVLFGNPYQKDWYDRVIHACALDKDIDMLVNGDLTLVGERGVTLSGGQKARVNLARAVYHQADVYLLDDPLSAVDVAVGKHIMEQCICGLLKDRLVVLVTHQVHFAIKADHILVLKEGEVEAFGSHSDLLSKGLDPQHLLGLISPSEDQQEQPCVPADKKTYLEDPSHVDHDHSGQNHALVSLHSHLEEEADSVSFKQSTADYDDKIEGYIGSVIPEEREQGTISTHTYYQYFRAGGHLLVLMVVFTSVLIGEVGIVAADWWIASWASCGDTLINMTSSSLPPTCVFNTDQRIYIYSGITLFAVIMSFVRSMSLYYVCVNSARVLHNRMFNAVLRSPVLFFDTNPIGRVLNRFSKDIGFLDDLLPYYFIDFILLASRCFAVVVTTLVANWWTILPAGVLLVGFLFVRWYFLKSAREIKRLEAVARSPVYSHLSMTLQGLTTIRSYGRQQLALEQFHDFQNQHTQAWYMYILAGRWLGNRVDILASFFITAVSFISVGLVDFFSDAGLIGLGLTYSISLTGTFLHTIQQSAEIENLMVSSERVMEYGRLKPEASLETTHPNEQPPEDWPQEGAITFQNTSFQYSTELPMVLKNICFSAKPFEKIGIVGRTGAGKSSLLSVLYRLAEPYGEVVIDGVDTKTIGLHDLRKKMSIIPQDPVLFSGTMRYNLDPFDEYSDTELWGVLEQVQLKTAVEELKGQLSGEVTEGGSNFSVGQRQLVCLARALLRKNKILILDEATANVDTKTDEIIQATIRSTFSECTVLTIAHRLNTIMDSDKILVLGDGRVKEFDSPLSLLQNVESHFSQMVVRMNRTASGNQTPSGV